MKIWPLLALALSQTLIGCAHKSRSLNYDALNEKRLEHRAWICRDLRAPFGDAPFLNFSELAPDRIVDLRVHPVPAEHYDGFAIPSDAYGPYHGEKVIDEDSPYYEAYRYRITDHFSLFLAALLPSGKLAAMGRDRDESRQNAAVEVSVNGQRYETIVHLLCHPGP